MAMHLNDIAQNTTKNMGRWSTNTFLMYIHKQIVAFSMEISKQMLNPIVFQSITFQPTNGSIVLSPAT